MDKIMSSPALSTQSDDDLFSIKTMRPPISDTIETIPLQRIRDSPEPETLPPMLPSQNAFTQHTIPRPDYGSQYITQPTQIIDRSPAPDISSPASRPVVQVAASSPMAPRPAARNPGGILANAMAPAGTSFRRPVPPQQQQSQTKPPVWDFDETPLSSDSDRAEKDRNSIKPKFGRPQQQVANRPPPPTGSTFGAIMQDAYYKPDSSHPVKRSADTMASSYGNVQKKPRQLAPARAMPVQPVDQFSSSPRKEEVMEVNDIVDPNTRHKVQRLLAICRTNTVQQAFDALKAKNNNFDDACDYLLLMSEKGYDEQKRQQETQQNRHNPVVLDDESADELAPTPARPVPRGVATSTQQSFNPIQYQPKKPVIKSIAQKYTSTQPIAPAPRRLDVFDTPPPQQETKKRTLMRGRKNRSPSPATRAAYSKKAITLDDSGDEADSGIQSDREAPSKDFDQRVMSFFNSCTVLELCDMSGIPKDQAEHVVASRPFRSIDAVFAVQNPNNKNKTKKAASSFGERIWDKVYEMMRSYEAVDYLVRTCEAMSKPLARSMSNWGVDVYGKGREGDGLDLTSLQQIAGNIPTSSGKDSGLGTPISDDGKPSSKKNFIPQPASLAEGVKMKDYQVVGINWLYLLFKEKLSGILADDMGLGKTLQTIAFIAHLAEVGETGPHLIVVPSATLENWLKEFQRFCPGLDVRPYYGSMAEREAMRLEYEDSRSQINVLVTTYQIAKAKDDIPFLRRYGFTCAIFDEGHMLKNPTSEVSTKLIRIKSRFRLMLTGTPLQNNLNELMALLRFLQPELFAEREEDLSAIFKQSISVTTEAASDSRQMLLSKQRIDRAKAMLTPFILRRKKYQVLKDLPAKARFVEYCDLSLEQEELYNAQLAKAWDIRERKSRGERIPAEENANVLIRLRQAAIHPLLFKCFYTDKVLRKIAKTCPKIEQFRESNPEFIMQELVAYADFETHELCSKHTLLHPFLLPPENWETSGKVTVLINLLDKFREEGHKTLIFSQFVMVLDILSIILRNRDIKFLRLDGSTRVDERQDLIDQFNAPESELECFMLSTKAGGAGINLTGASRVVVFDSGFNPQDDVQAENRCHRIGQTKDVEIYRLVTRGSVEEQIYDMGRVKLQLDREVAGEEGTGDGISTPAELDEDIVRGKKGKQPPDLLSKKEQEGANMIEDMLFKKLEEEGKTPAKIKAELDNKKAVSTNSSQSRSQTTKSPRKLTLKVKMPIKKESAVDSSTSSPLTELSSSLSSSDDDNDSDEDTITIKKTKNKSPLKHRPSSAKHADASDAESSSNEIIELPTRNRRKAAEKASSQLKRDVEWDLENENEDGSQRSNRSRKGSARGSQNGGSQTTISRSGRLVKQAR